MQAFQADLSAFEARNAQVLGVSGDDLDTHRRFTKKFGIRFPLISDAGGKVAALYSGTTRITYVIDREGTIRHVEPGVPDNRRILEVLRGIEGGN